MGEARETRESTWNVELILLGGPGAPRTEIRPDGGVNHEKYERHETTWNLEPGTWDSPFVADGVESRPSG